MYRGGDSSSKALGVSAADRPKAKTASLQMFMNQFTSKVNACSM
jgi:hypothetical protein